MNDPLRRIVIATGNPGKLKEIRQILAGSDLEIVPQSDFDYTPAEETGDTFLANALLKAHRAASETGLPAIGDDSGLVVDALNGEPGVYSARYAGNDATDEQNIDKLLAELRDRDTDDRTATFRCVAVAVFPDAGQAPLVAEGEWRGSIATSPRGVEGFGYDPVFFDTELGRCAAEITAEEKNARSHRGQAFQQLCEWLRNISP